MFEEILGIPAHALIVHAAVVFVPLQIAAAIAFALVPFVRRYTAWLVAGLAVVAPAAAWAAKLSGEALKQRLIRNNMTSPESLANIDEHRNFATMAAWGSLTLAVLMVLLVFMYLSRSRRGGNPDVANPQPSPSGKGMVAIVVVLTIAAVGVSGYTGFYVFKAGDTGAHMVWEGK